MFEKVGRAAEKAATSVGTSRRGFLGQLGRAAAVAAVAAGGVLASASRASAGPKPCKCTYEAINGGQYDVVFVNTCSECPPLKRGWIFLGCGCSPR